MSELCHNCGVILTNDNWYPSFRGRHWRCKDCWNKLQHEWRKRHTNVSRSVVGRYMLKLKRKALEKVGGVKCVNCGCDEIRALEINHVNGGGSKEKRAARLHGSLFYRAIASGRRSTEGLDVRCRVCNALYDTQTRLGVKGHIVVWKGR